MVRPKRDNFWVGVKLIGLRILENRWRCTIGSLEPSKWSICGILNRSGKVTADSVYPSSKFEMEFTPCARLNNFSSLLTLREVGSTSNSNGCSVWYTGALEACGGMGSTRMP